jgi:ribosomal protein S18 acetylase RimI-like enzyme
MTEDSYKIRLARNDELRAIQEIESAAAYQFSDTDYSFVIAFDPIPLDLLAERQKENQLWVAANAEDKAVGFVVARILDDAIYIHELDVHPSHGRRGLGRRLIAAVCDSAKNAGLSAATLSTFRDIAWNAPFYAKLGFRILTDDELTPGLSEVRRREAESGLPLDHRVCMRMEF